ncbi:MAG: ABC transporter ATP-binding protein [Candidatus Eisenbacteria sp.]|nr:ABC transporter ATP-binding protein [Candidatus Eisenbacteria bacterium]
MQAPAVRLIGIERRFGKTIANTDVDLNLRPASIHALVGENGAGKSTLMRILYGLLQPDRGTIEIDGRAVEIASPAVALRHGIGMIHQHFMLVPPMTVLENIVLGFPGQRGLRRLPRRALAARLRRLFDDYGFDLDPHAPVESLGVGERQRVEIARLLFHGARLLICDEPTAVLAPPEVDGLFRILRRFRDEGRTVVFITHKLAEVLAIADRVTVLRRGRVVGELARDELDHDRLVQWIIGEGARPTATIGGGAQRSAQASGGVRVLVAEELGVVNAAGRALLAGVSLDLHRGEIVGIAGVQGNGQRELAEVMSGRRTFDRGSLRIGETRIGPGQRVPPALRPALIPEDRTTEGLVPGLPLWENLLLGHLADASVVRWGWYSHGAARRWAQPLLDRFRVQPPRADLTPEALSGGNQQKLLCAREFARHAPILVAAQPTRGIDLGSTAFLHDLLREVRRAGGSVLLISADLDEILALADSVAVLYRGRLSRAWARTAIDVEFLGRAMVGMLPLDADPPERETISESR